MEKSDLGLKLGPFLSFSKALSFTDYSHGRLAVGGFIYEGEVNKHRVHNQSLELEENGSFYFGDKRETQMTAMLYSIYTWRVKRAEGTPVHHGTSACCLSL